MEEKYGDREIKQVRKDDELKRFRYLTDELKELMGFKRITSDDFEMDFIFDSEAYYSHIKFTEDSDSLPTDTDVICEMLAPNWYYIYNFYHNPFEGRTWIDLLIDDGF